MTSSTTTPLQTGGKVRDTAVGLSCARLAIVEDDGRIRIFRRGTGSKLWLPHAYWRAPQNALSKVAWSHQGLLATGSDAGNVSIWTESVQDSKSNWQLAGALSFRSGVTALAFAPGLLGLYLAVAFADGHVRVLRHTTGTTWTGWQLSNTFSACSSSPCTCLSWRPAGEAVPMIAVGTAEGAKVWIHEAAWGRWCPAAALQSDGPVCSLHWAPNTGGRELVAVAGGRNVAMYSLSGTANDLQVERLAKLEHQASVTSLQWNDLGTWLAAATDDCQVQQWRPNLAGEWTLQGRFTGSCRSEASNAQASMEAVLAVD